MPIIEVDSEQSFQDHLSSAGDNIVVADFTAAWCGACRIIAPVLEQMSTNYQRASFLKVDVDKCPDLAANQDIFILPTFIAYKRKFELFRIEGSDVGQLETKIKQEVQADENEDLPKGFTSLEPFILHEESECLNELSPHTLSNALSSENSGFLQSDSDGQLLISITFNQIVKIHSFIIQAPPESGPKNIRIFKNRTKALAFDEIDNTLSAQDFEMSPVDLEKGNQVKLRYVRFQNVKNIQIFVENNQSHTNRTQINYIGFIGRQATLSNLREIAPVVWKDFSDGPSSSKEDTENSHDSETAEKSKEESEAQSENPSKSE